MKDLSAAAINVFFADINENRTGSFATQLPSFNEVDMDAWIFLYKNLPNSDKRVSYEILHTTGIHISDDTFLGKLGKGNSTEGKRKYAAIVSSYTGQCKSCQGGYEWLKKADGYLTQIYKFVNKYNEVPGSQDALEPAYKNSQAYSQDGMYFMTKVANDLVGVTGFDAVFETQEGQFNCPKQECKYDIKILNNYNGAWIECKSYQNPSAIPTNQLLKYLSKPIESLREISYYFNKDKLSATGDLQEADGKARRGVRTVFLSIAKEIFNSNRNLFIGLRLRLNDGTLVNNELLFETYCQESDYNNVLYDFVKIK